MKKIILFLTIGALLTGCGTNFQQRKVVYIAIYKKVAKLVRVIGPIAAEVYLDKKVAEGEITELEKEQMLAIAESTIKKLKDDKPRTK